jgi:plastocyanin
MDYGNGGAAEAHNVQVVDTYDTGGIPLLEPPQVGSWPPVPHTTSGDTLTFGVGSLLPGQGGHIFIEALLPISVPPGTLVTNTVTINADQDADLSNNTAQVVAEIPFLPPWITFPRPGSICTDTFTITGRVQVVAMPSMVDVDVYVDGALHQTVHPNSEGVWHSQVSGLSDGLHEIWAQAHYMGMTSSRSQVIEILVDSNLFWSPISLHFTDQDGFVLFPRDDTGRMDQTGWSVFLRPNHTYTVAVYICCVDPNAQVTLEVGGQTVVLTDPDGDGWYEGIFTTPAQLSGVIRLCVTCGLIQRCSDGNVLVDPEGTVYDRQTRQEVEGALVACYQEQAGLGGGGVFDLWPAVDFSQVNPQTTGADGYYSFFTPAGTYRVEVTKDGYQRHLSPDLVVVDDPVTYDVYLAPELTEDADYTITIGPLGFDPAVLSAFKGAVVEWVNLDTELHASVSVTPTQEVGGLSSADAWNSGLLAAGESYKLRLDTPGTYTYRDGENGIVTGQILVAPSIYLPIVVRP